jgi:hypothetical protein
MTLLPSVKTKKKCEFYLKTHLSLCALAELLVVGATG